MAIKDALDILKAKPVLGEYGATTRPFVILDVDEYNAIVKTLEDATKRPRVPREAKRQSPTV